MPTPRPIIRQFARSAEVPCNNRGYQASGTAKVRPSSNEITNSSSVTDTDLASAVCRVSLAEVAIPRLQEHRLVRLHQSRYAPQLCTSKTGVLMEADGTEPELRLVVIPRDVDVLRLATIARKEEKPIGPDPENCRHLAKARARFPVPQRREISFGDCVSRRSKHRPHHPTPF